MIHFADKPLCLIFNNSVPYLLPGFKHLSVERLQGRVSLRKRMLSAASVSCFFAFVLNHEKDEHVSESKARKANSKAERAYSKDQKAMRLQN